MGDDNLTVEILREIRDAGREMSERIDQTNQRLDQTNQRLDQTNQRLDQTNQRLDQTNQRLVETEIRLATAITDMHGTLGDIKTLLASSFDVRGRVERCENDIDAIKKHIGI